MEYLRVLGGSKEAQKIEAIWHRPYWRGAFTTCDAATWRDGAACRKRCYGRFKLLGTLGYYGTYA